jgi:hypothetical protein
MSEKRTPCLLVFLREARRLFRLERGLAEDLQS